MGVHLCHSGNLSIDCGCKVIGCCNRNEPWGSQLYSVRSEELFTPKYVRILNPQEKIQGFFSDYSDFLVFFRIFLGVRGFCE